MRVPLVGCCILSLAACAFHPTEVPKDSSSLSIHADMIFVGRIVSSQPMYLVLGDVFMDAYKRTFEPVYRPGASVVAYDKGLCPSDNVGSGALLVFLRRDAQSRDGHADQPLHVYACSVLDTATVDQITEYEVCFQPNPPEYACSKY